MASADDYERLLPLDELKAEGRAIATVDQTPLAAFYHEGEVRVVDNRCPHMGFPLAKGTVDEGVLTCHWHHARFELSCGDTFDPWADDVQTYPTEVRDGDVYVDPNPPRDQPPAEHWADRLETGLEENLRLVVAKAVVGLDGAGVDPGQPIATGVEFGTRYREMGWSSGLTILGCMANVLDDLGPRDRQRALYTGLRHVASDCAGEAPNFDQPALRASDVSPERLKSWFRENVEVRDSDGAERVLRTAVETCSREHVEEMLFAAATDHVYLDTGHTLDFCNKAVETLDHVGWDAHAGDALASLVDSLTGAERAEEGSSWRQPVDVASMLFDAYGGGPGETSGLEALRAEGGSERSEEPPESERAKPASRADATWDPDRDALRETLLGDDPQAIVDALTDAVAAGASPSDLADVVCDAAATRVAQFGTANEFGDWNTVHHTFTYANAVREAAHRVETTELYRGAFDAAMNVYLDRFLNQPPTRVPEVEATDRDPDAIRENLLGTFDAEGRVDEAGKLVAEYLAAEGDVDALMETLGEALLREDAGFHTLQAFECGRRQWERAWDDRGRRVALVAVARYFAAHFPTRREAEQTFSIATRLHKGERLHE